MKPSNGVEEKTELIISIMFDGALNSQKQSVLRREEVHFKSVMNRCFFFSGTQTDSLSGYSGLVIPVETENWVEKPYMGVALTHFSILPLG
ncbi:hypothetical protein [Vibrio breoganii]|uniref:hypothetical protein n=1 Tax=Vibrio breoganii TaxID=553239 RepID=UPI0039A59610